MIRSTKVSLKFANPGKRSELDAFVAEYARITREFVDKLWELDKVDTLLDSDLTGSISSWLSARAIQCAGKQASGIVRGTRQKQKQRLWQIEKFKKLGQFKKARKLQKVYDSKTTSKPSLENIHPALDSRFVSVDLDNPTSFDGWVTISSLGNNLKIKLPFKRTEHFNRLGESGKLRGGIRLFQDRIEFAFDIPDPEQRISGKTIGIDIGQKTIVTCSDGQSVDSDHHGHTYQSICDTLARRKKGSNGFRRAQQHRSNFIGWALNRLDLDGVKRVNRENIKNLGRGRNLGRSLSRWNYFELKRRLDARLEELGVQVVLVSPTYTSQRCSECGWVRKRNRNGKSFKCGHCGLECDSDLNASRNIALDLTPISKSERLKQPNRKGFFWHVSNQEPIVPDPHETLD